MNHDLMKREGNEVAAAVILETFSLILIANVEKVCRMNNERKYFCI